MLHKYNTHADIAFIKKLINEIIKNRQTIQNQKSSMPKYMKFMRNIILLV